MHCRGVHCFDPYFLKALAPAGLRGHDTGDQVDHFAGLHPSLHPTATWKIEQFPISTFILFHGRKTMKTWFVSVCDKFHAIFVQFLFVVSVPGIYMMLSVGH